MLNLKQLVFLSNSVPKSGSTYLYSLQRNFLESVCRKPKADYGILSEENLEQSGYVSNPHSKKFLEIICSGDLQDGPYVLKTHALLNGRLREAFLENSHIFVSTATRDPVDIYFSARDNFRSTGEFPEFESLETGTATINGYFARILRSSVKAGRRKELPIVKYEDIVSRPLETMISSFSQDILKSVSLETAKEHTSIEKASRMARNRMNKGSLKRHDAEDPSDEAAQVLQSVRNFTEVMNSIT